MKLFNLQKGDAAGKPVAFLQHGMMSSSETWVDDGDDSIPYKLIDDGYDVWMGNNRGNIYSRRHRDIETRDEYFNFSFYELGKYDLPAMIDYVRTETSADKVSFIGHSQGTSQMFSALSKGHGDLADKVNVFLAMGPAVRLENIQEELFQYLAADVNDIQWWLDFFGMDELFSWEWELAMSAFCWYEWDFCQAAEDAIWPRGVIFDTDVVPYEDQVAQNTVSAKGLVHYGQIVERANFQEFDYDDWAWGMNNQMYGQSEPPTLDVEAVSNPPIHLYIGSQDTLTTPEDC